MMGRQRLLCKLTFPLLATALLVGVSVSAFGQQEVPACVEDLGERRLLVLRDSKILRVDDRLSPRDLVRIVRFKRRFADDADKLILNKLLRSGQGELVIDPNERIGAACGIPPNLT